MSLVLGDDRRQLGEFGNLTPARVVVARSRLGRQRSLALVRTVGTWGTIYLTRSGGRRWR